METNSNISSNSNSLKSSKLDYNDILKRFDLLQINSEININLENNILDFYKKYEQFKKCHFLVSTFEDSKKYWEMTSDQEKKIAHFKMIKDVPSNSLIDGDPQKRKKYFKPENKLFDLIKRKIEYILYLMKKSETEIEQIYYLKMQKYLPIINLQINEFKNKIFERKLKYFFKKKIEMKEFKNDYYNRPNTKKNFYITPSHFFIGIVFDPFYDVTLALVQSILDKKFFICFKSLEGDGKEPIEIRYNENNAENTLDEILFFKMSKFYNNLLILGVKDNVKKLIKINYMHDKIYAIELVRVINEPGEITFFDELHIQNKTYTILGTKNKLKIFDNLDKFESDSTSEIEFNDCSNFNVNQKTNQIFFVQKRDNKFLGCYKKLNQIHDLENLHELFLDSKNVLFQTEEKKPNNKLDFQFKSYLFENYTLIYERDDRLHMKLSLYQDNTLLYKFDPFLSSGDSIHNLFLTRTSENELIIITINSNSPNNVFVFLFNENDKECSVIQTIDVRKHLNKYRLQLDHGNVNGSEDLTDFILYNEDEKKLIREDGSAYNVTDENKVINIYEKLKIKKSYFDHYSNKIFLHLETDSKYQNICVLDIVNM